MQRQRCAEYSAHLEIDDKPPGSFRKKSARGCMFMGNKQITEIRFGKLGGSQSLFLSSRGARPFFDVLSHGNKEALLSDFGKPPVACITKPMKFFGVSEAALNGLTPSFIQLFAPFT